MSGWVRPSLEESIALPKERTHMRRRPRPHLPGHTAIFLPPSRRRQAVPYIARPDRDKEWQRLCRLSAKGSRSTQKNEYHALRKHIRSSIVLGARGASSGTRTRIPGLEGRCPGRWTIPACGGDSRARTDGLLRAKQVLSQLSYIPIGSRLLTLYRGLRLTACAVNRFLAVPLM